MRPFSSRVFSLPKSHTISHLTTDRDDLLEFIVWCLGFFLGVRLTTTEAGFVDATPIRDHALTDFILSRSSIDKALELAETFWLSNARDDRRAKLVTAIIHALFVGQTPNLFQYERFNYLYFALDACFALTQRTARQKRRVPHFRRIQSMCEQFGIAVPDWALAEAGNSEVSLLRNDSIHEALFAGAPLGFALYGLGSANLPAKNIPLEMEALTCRLLVALLGRPDAAYVRSPVTTRQIHGLEL